MKPIVHYRTDVPVHVVVGLPALVQPIDHYAADRVSNTRHVITSKVVGHDANTGEFETLNTRYIPQERN